MRGMDCGTIEMGRTGRGQRRLQLLDPGARVETSPSNHLGRSVFPAIGSLDDAGRHLTRCGDDRAGALHAVASRTA